MDLLRAVCLFAVPDACPCGGHLEVSALEHFAIAHRIAAKIILVSTKDDIETQGDVDVLLELASNDVREHLELAMPMRAKPGARCYSVLIDDAERAKLRVLVPSEQWRLDHIDQVK